MTDELATGLLIAAAFAVLAWPHLRRALGLGAGMTAAAVKARLDSGAAVVLLDVRGAEEAASGSLPGAVNIPLPELASRIRELLAHISERPDAGVIVFCQGGARAERALPILAGAGLRKLTVLKGGVSGWRKAGFELSEISLK